MPNRRLTPAEIASLNELQARTVSALAEMAAGDDELLFALRRRLFTRLMHLERGTPIHRTKLKRLKWKAQDGKCAICGKAMDQKGSELDRAKASDGYTVENTRLVHHECHVADQRSKGFSDEVVGSEAAYPVQRPTQSAPFQRDVMRNLFREYGDDRDAVCAAYVKAELAGEAPRKRKGSTTPEAYAKALWANGKARGWLAT